MLGLGVVSELWKDAELKDLVSNLISKTLKADVQLVQDSAELYGRLVRCGVQSSLSLGRDNPDSTRETAAVIKRMVQVNAAYYSTLVDLNLKFTHHLLETLHSQEAQNSTQAAPRPPSNQAATLPTMKLAGRVGDRLRAPFRVENNRTEPTTVTFRLSHFVRTDGGQSVASQATFDPAAMELPAHQEARTFLDLPITADFEPGQTYTATLSVDGIEGMGLGVQLDVRSAV